MRALLTLLFLPTLPAACATQTIDRQADVARAVASITQEDFRRRVEVIAHDSMMGRDTPSPGLELTATWIAAAFERFGLEPGGDDGSYVQRYEISQARIDERASDISTSAGTLRFGPRWIVLGLLGGAAAFGVIASRDSLRPAEPTTPLRPLPRSAPRLSEVLRFDQLLRAVASRPQSYTVHARRVSVRSLPGMRGDVVAVLGRGDRVRGIRSRQGWVEVARAGTTNPIGWVSAGDLGPTYPKTGR